MMNVFPCHLAEFQSSRHIVPWTQGGQPFTLIPIPGCETQAAARKVTIIAMTQVRVPLRTLGVADGAP